MALVQTNTDNPIRGIIANPNKKQRKACEDVIDKFTFADLGRGSGKLHWNDTARLDMQGTTKDGTKNLQVQIGHFSVSAILVADSVLEITGQSNEDLVTATVISLLKSSMITGTIWTLGGTLP